MVMVVDGFLRPMEGRGHFPAPFNFFRHQNGSLLQIISCNNQRTAIKDPSQNSKLPLEFEKFAFNFKIFFGFSASGVNYEFAIKMYT